MCASGIAPEWILIYVIDLNIPSVNPNIADGSTKRGIDGSI